MTQPKESEMNANENIRNEAPEEVIVLGVASVETKGAGGVTENYGEILPGGISEA